MKPRNFPMKKLRRQLVAAHGFGAEFLPEDKLALDGARAIRTKKNRSSRGRRAAQPIQNG